MSKGACCTRPVAGTCPPMDQTPQTQRRWRLPRSRPRHGRAPMALRAPLRTQDCGSVSSSGGVGVHTALTFRALGRSVVSVWRPQPPPHALVSAFRPRLGRKHFWPSVDASAARRGANTPHRLPAPGRTFHAPVADPAQHLAIVGQRWPTVGRSRRPARKH